MITIRPRQIATTVFLAVVLARGPAECQAPPSSPATPTGQGTTVVAATGGCLPGWVCIPGTDRCDPTYICGTCPDTKTYKGNSWSYLNDGSALARETQTDPKLIPVIDPRRPCG